jgi:hypothetical protein
MATVVSTNAPRTNTSVSLIASVQTILFERCIGQSAGEAFVWLF